ncbi:flagellar biosynthetic protein FliR [Legionella sp. CNM-4043-24]|uniref:flagellar biosynthetic protein FliR n=1 Tax=Legionella sp. CNM-4043-24 TaxID=3421646 RepID=UPI00403AE034
MSVFPMTKIFMIAIRLGTVVLFSPVEAFRVLPVHARLLLVLMLSLFIAGNVSMPAISADNVSLGLSGLSEFCNGLILTLGLYACFAVFQIAGQLIDTQMGMNALAVLNPTDDSHDPLSGRLLMMLSVLFFFALNGHHRLMQGIVFSFSAIPPGKPLIFEHLSPIFQQFSLMFSFSLMLAGPIIFSLLIVDLSGAMITRNMPQVSTYFLTLPIKIMLGFFMFTLLLNYINPFMDKLFQSHAELLDKVMR